MIAEQVVQYRQATREEYENYIASQKPKVKDTDGIEESKKNPAVAKSINQIILKLTQRKGIVPSYDTVNRYLNKNHISFEVAAKPIILEQISIMKRKYIPNLEYGIYFRTMLNRINVDVTTINVVVMNRMAVEWQWLIFHNEGYVSRDTLFKKVGGDKNVLFYYYKLLLEAKWYVVKDDPYYNLADRSCSISTRYWLGSGHPHYAQEPERELNEWQKL